MGHPNGLLHPPPTYYYACDNQVHITVLATGFESPGLKTGPRMPAFRQSRSDVTGNEVKTLPIRQVKVKYIYHSYVPPDFLTLSYYGAYIYS